MAAPRALRKRLTKLETCWEEAGRGWWRVALQQLHLCPGAVLDKAGSFPSGFWPLGLSRSVSAGGHSENPTFGSKVCRQAISLGGLSPVICVERPRSLSCLGSCTHNHRGRGKMRNRCENQNRAKPGYCSVFCTGLHGQARSRFLGSWRWPWRWRSGGPRRPQRRERASSGFPSEVQPLCLKMGQINALSPGASEAISLSVIFPAKYLPAFFFFKVHLTWNFPS